MINNVSIKVTLGDDPKTGESQYGKWAFFRGAYNWKAADKTGTWWLNFMATNWVVERVEQLKKGDTVIIIGKLKTKNNKEGQEQMVVDVLEIGKEIATEQKQESISAAVEEMPF